MAKKDKPDKKDKKEKARRAEEVVLAEPILRDVADELPGGGAGLCYGEPVREGRRTVIPVARVGGSGDTLAAQPLGYIEVDAAGTRYVALGDASRERMLTGIVAAAAALLGALLGVALARRGR